MIVSFDQGGMETPLSMSFLVISIILIASAASLMHPNGDGGDLCELRYLQVRDMGRCIMELISKGPPAFEQETTISGVSLLIWNGTGLIYDRAGTTYRSEMGSVLSMTPDDLWSVAILTDHHDHDPVLDIEVAVFSGNTAGGSYLILYLPIHRTDMPEPEVFL